MEISQKYLNLRKNYKFYEISLKNRNWNVDLIGKIKNEIKNSQKKLCEAWKTLQFENKSIQKKRGKVARFQNTFSF